MVGLIWTHSLRARSITVEKSWQQKPKAASYGACPVRKEKERLLQPSPYAVQGPRPWNCAANI